MTKTIKSATIYVILSNAVSKLPKSKWWNAVIVAVSKQKKWGIIIANGELILTSEMGSFKLNNKSFASGLMCDLATWKTSFSNDFAAIVKAIDPEVKVVETEFPVEY